MKSLRSNRKRPTHPGAILREDVFPALGMNQTEIATALGVSRRSISQIVNEHRPLTVDMALRLAHFLGTTPDSWLKMQQALDIWLLEQKNSKQYLHISTVKPKLRRALQLV